MPFDINVFTTRLKELFIASPLFPNAPEYYVNAWGNSQKNSDKHKGREPLKLKKAVFDCMNTTTVYSQDEVSFDIGSEQLERTHPYYHILENSPVIRKKDKGTDKSRGSQAQVQDVAKRDYERVSFNGKTFTKEYARNVRGQRNRINNVSHYITDSRGNTKMVNREASAYQNVHYMYIENILDSGILELLANEFGMTLKRKSNTGLREEYALQEGFSGLQDIIDSFA